MVVDEVWNQPRASGRLGITYCLVPIEHWRTAWVGVDVCVEMRKVSLAHDEIRNAISIDVREGGSVQLREGNVACVFGGEIIHHHVLDKGDLSLRISLLFEPGQSSSMPVERCNHIIEAVAVHVIHGHHAATHHAAAVTSKDFWMIGPAFLIAAHWWLLPPSVGADNVHATIAVDVAH